MKSFKIKLISTFFFLFIVLICDAQSNLFEQRNLSQINVDSYSDADIMTIRNKMSSMGMDDDKAIEILKAKGMSSVQAGKLLDRLNNVPTGKSQTTAKESDRSYSGSSSTTPMESAD